MYFVVTSKGLARASYRLQARVMPVGLHTITNSVDALEQQALSNEEHVVVALTLTLTLTLTPIRP